MSSSDLDFALEYMVFCTTENKYVSIWKKTTDDEPTTCPNDPTTHTIDSSKTYVRKRQIVNSVKVKEEDINTGGHFMSTTVKLTAPTNSTTSLTLSFPIDITVMNVQFASEEINRGDKVSLSANKNTPIGVIMSPLSAPSAYTTTTYDPNVSVIYNNIPYTSIASVPSDALPTDTTYWSRGFGIPLTNTSFLKKGYCIGLGAEVLQRVVNYSTNYVYTELAPSSTVNPGTYVLMSVYKIKDYEFGAPKDHNIGSAKIGGTYVPADTVITIDYQNNSNTDIKEIVGVVEYLY